jgi:hypothetical protein
MGPPYSDIGRKRIFLNDNVFEGIRNLMMILFDWNLVEQVQRQHVISSTVISSTDISSAVILSTHKQKFD